MKVVNYVDITQKVVQSEDYDISCQKQLHGSEVQTQKHTDIHDSCKIFYITGLDEKYLTSVLIHTPKKKLWKNSDHAMVKAWKAQADFQFGFIPLSGI